MRAAPPTPRSWGLFTQPTPVAARARGERARLKPLPAIRLELPATAGAGGAGGDDPRPAQYLLGAQPPHRRAGGGASLRRAPGSVVWAAQSRAASAAAGRAGHRIEYRHVIDWLVRKPGALRTTVTARTSSRPAGSSMAYDALAAHQPATASKQYLAILLAARESETGSTRACAPLMLGAADRGGGGGAGPRRANPPPRRPRWWSPRWTWPPTTRCCRKPGRPPDGAGEPVGRVSEGTPPPDDPQPATATPQSRRPRKGSPTSATCSAGRARIRSPPPAPHRAAGAGSRLPLDKNLATLTLGRLPESAAAVWGVARRAVPGPQGERARFR